MGSNVEAKSICVHKLEDLLLEPMFTIFHVQHSQIAAKTETKNSLIYHLKCSMAKVRHWNSQTVRDFCANLVTRFPALGQAFPHLFGELQELTCKILNDSSESSFYMPVREELHTFIHSFISACSDAFISHTHWFSVEESSTEYQSCKNNAKTRMQQANIVENTVMNFVKAGPKPEEVFEHDDDVESIFSEHSEIQELQEHSDHSQTSEKSNEEDVATGNKSIDLVSGLVKDGDEKDNDDTPQFSTPFADEDKKLGEPNEVKEVEEGEPKGDGAPEKDSDFDSESDSGLYDKYSSSDSSDDDSSDDDSSDDDSSDDDSSDDDSDDSESSDDDSSDDDSSDDDSDDSELSDDSDTTDYDTSSSSDSDSRNASKKIRKHESTENTMRVPSEMVAHLLSLQPQKKRRK